MDFTPVKCLFVERKNVLLPCKWVTFYLKKMMMTNVAISRNTKCILPKKKKTEKQQSVHAKKYVVVVK